MKTDRDHLEPWPVRWQAEQVARFWNYASSNPGAADQYFSKQRGDALLDYVARSVSLRGVALDLGAGPGHLVEKLIGRGVDTLAVDVAPTSIAALLERLGGREHFLGGRVIEDGIVPLDDGTADLVFLVETVEHLDDEVLDGVLSEAQRVTRPGGHVVITTPNNEDLARSQVMCPNCSCVFHTWQHVRSWTAATLATKMAGADLQTVSCRPTLLSGLELPLRYLHRPLWTFLRRPLPHLVYIGRKTGGSPLP